jgi:hypothetical protein
MEFTFKSFRTIIVFGGQPVSAEVFYDQRYNLIGVMDRANIDLMAELSAEQIRTLAIKVRIHAGVRAA